MINVRPIRAKAALVRHAKDFFERELFGIITLAETTTRPPEKEVKIPGRRQLDKEELIVDFGQYSLVISSSVVVAPLGRLRLFDRTTNTNEEGPIDSATWSRFGQIVRSRPLEVNRREDPHVDG
jgi:hypothetical protein